MKKFRSFEDARESVHSLNLLSRTYWEQYSKSGKKPLDIPVSPQSVYKNKGWKSWGDWLGTGNIAKQLRIYRSFDDARTFARTLNLRNHTEWEKLSINGQLPKDIPSHPQTHYKKKGWKSWGDWLGTGTISLQLRVYRSFDDARTFARTLNLKSQNEWVKLSTHTQLPKDIPNTPSYIYKKEWKGWGDFLGTGNIASFRREFRSFENARQFVRKLNLTSQRNWFNYCKSGKKPIDIPQKPSRTYSEEWKGFGDWLGNERIADQKKMYRSFEEASKFVSSLKIKNQQEWVQYCKSGKKPIDIPQKPSRTYSEEWKGFGDWLGNGKTRNFRSFEDAEKFTRSLSLQNYTEWKKLAKRNQLPKDIPIYPDEHYKKKGWKSWGDFLGTGTISVQVKSKQWKNFHEAKLEIRKLAKLHNLKTLEDYTRAKKLGLIPDYIPSHPWEVYSKKRKNEETV